MQSPDRRTRIRNGGIGCAVLIVAMLACARYGNSLPPPPTPTATPVPSATASPAPATPEPTDDPAGVTLANYERVQTGMTLAEVEAIFGKPGGLLSEFSAAGITTQTIVWQRGIGNATITFQNGTVWAKGQALLR